MPRKGKNYMKSVIITVLVIALIGGLGWFGYDRGWFSGSEQTGLGTTDESLLAGCPDDHTTTVTFNLKNGLNTTNNQLFDVTMYLDDSTSLTDTTAGTDSESCAKPRSGKIISVDSSGGDSARITSASGTCANIKVVDGNIQYTPSGDECTVNMIGKLHGVLEFRAFDVINNAFMYDSADASASDYETDGVNFTSITGNTTATAVGSGGELHIKEYARSSTDATDFSDFGFYILVDAAPSVWDKPVVKVDGQTLSQASLNDDEKIAWAGYEYVYYIDKAITRTGEIAIDFDIFALSGVNPTGANDVEIDYASRGQFVSLEGVNQVNRAGVQDDSSRTVVYTVQDTVIDVS